MVAADAEKVVLRTIATKSAIFVLLNISYLPAELLRLVVTLGFPDNSAPTSGADSMTTAATHRRRLQNAWVIPDGRSQLFIPDNVFMNIE